MDKQLVLVVEDNPAVRRTLTAALARAGYHVASAGSALAALSLVEASALAPVALVIDVVLPDAHARELVTLLRARLGVGRLVLISGHVHIDGEALVDELGATFLRKPFGMRQLIDAVRAAP